jgi:hypothetical protein
MTTEFGPLIAAMLTLPSCEDSHGSTSCSEAWTATIAPTRRPPPPSTEALRALSTFDGNSCINRPRAATSVAASSRDSTPATCAAASSPIECPAT